MDNTTAITILCGDSILEGSFIDITGEWSTPSSIMVYPTKKLITFGDTTGEIALHQLELVSNTTPAVAMTAIFNNPSTIVIKMQQCSITIEGCYPIGSADMEKGTAALPDGKIKLTGATKFKILKNIFNGTADDPAITSGTSSATCGNQEVTVDDVNMTIDTGLSALDTLSGRAYIPVPPAGTIILSYTLTSTNNTTKSFRMARKSETTLKINGTSYINCWQTGGGFGLAKTPDGKPAIVFKERYTVYGVPSTAHTTTPWS